MSKLISTTRASREGTVVRDSEDRAAVMNMHKDINIITRGIQLPEIIETTFCALRETFFKWSVYPLVHQSAPMLFSAVDERRLKMSVDVSLNVAFQMFYTVWQRASRKCQTIEDKVLFNRLWSESEDLELKQNKTKQIPYWSINTTRCFRKWFFHFCGFANTWKIH